LISPDFKLTEGRGVEHQRADGILIVPTTQPAYVMRLVNLVDRETAERERANVVADLAHAVRLTSRAP
jgi:hypothetical protein